VQEVGGSNPLAPIDNFYRLIFWVGINTITRALASQFSGVFLLSSRFLHVLTVCATVIHLDGRFGRTKRHNSASDSIHRSCLELVSRKPKIRLGVGHAYYLPGNWQTVGAGAGGKVCDSSCYDRALGGLHPELESFETGFAAHTLLLPEGRLV
jgi:hypothetical protein